MKGFLEVLSFFLLCCWWCWFMFCGNKWFCNVFIYLVGWWMIFMFIEEYIDKIYVVGKKLVDGFVFICYLCLIVVEFFWIVLCYCKCFWKVELEVCFFLNCRFGNNFGRFDLEVFLYLWVFEVIVCWFLLLIMVII